MKINELTQENMAKNEASLEWLKKHLDTVVILGGVLSSVFWMNGKFKDLDKRLIRIETILVMKGIIPPELAFSTLEVENIP